MACWYIWLEFMGSIWLKYSIGHIWGVGPHFLGGGENDTNLNPNGHVSLVSGFIHPEQQLSSNWIISTNIGAVKNLLKPPPKSRLASTKIHHHLHHSYWAGRKKTICIQTPLPKQKKMWRFPGCSSDLGGMLRTVSWPIPPIDFWESFTSVSWPIWYDYLQVWCIFMGFLRIFM